MEPPKRILTILLLYSFCNATLCVLYNISREQAEFEEFVRGTEQLKRVSEEYVYVEESLDAALLEELNKEQKTGDTADSSHNITVVDEYVYDFIVVGAGAAGSVVAARLSAYWKVLLLEAGELETPFTLIPAMAGYVRNSPYNWGYLTEEEENCCKGMIDNKCMVGGGKAVGGSSAINQMLYTRGNMEDYNNWPQESRSDRSWQYPDVREFFKKLENHYLATYNKDWYGNHGPVHIKEGYLSKNGIVYKAFLDAAMPSNVKEVSYNGEGSQLGFNRSQVTIKDGKRVSAAQAYLVPQKDNKNLVIKHSSRVLKIIIEDMKAVGVKYLKDGKIHEVKACKEIIVSAGAINTPQILLLSGIGPKEDLEELGIPVIKDLPVGRNLKDHLMYIGSHYFSEEPIRDITADDIKEYLANKTGKLTSVDTDVIYFISPPGIHPLERERPILEMVMFIDGFSEGHEKLKDYRITKEIYDSVWKPVEGKQILTMAYLLFNPQSSGYVKLKSRDPLHWPVIKLNCFDNPKDLELLADNALNRTYIWRGQLQTIGYEINESKVKGCEHIKDYRSKEYHQCAVKILTVSARHHHGTCRMGRDGVVNVDLKVHDVENLRVVDASIFPISISGHLYGPVLMLGERASSIIEEAWINEDVEDYQV